MPRLDQLCNIQYGYAFNADLFTTKSSQGVPLVRIRDVVRGYTETYTPESFSEAYRVHDGDILIGMDGEFNVARWHGGDAALNQRVCKITPRNNIHSQYLFYFLPQALKRIEDQTPFVTVKHLSAKKLSAIEVPDISMMEQANIAERLDIITTLLANRRQVDEQLAELPKARFVEMFGDPVVNPMGWEVVPFTTCATIDTNMVQDFTGYEDFPHIGIDSIEKNTGKILAYRTIREDRVISGKYLFTPKHIIYSKIRPNLNKVALPTFDGLCSADAYPILPNAENCNRIYLAYMLRSKRFLNYILAFSSRTNMPKVNRKQVEGFRLPLPPLPAQRRFAAFARACAAQRAACARQIAVLETLWGKLLQDAFGAAG